MKKIIYAGITFAIVSTTLYAQTQDSWAPVQVKDQSSQTVNYRSYIDLPSIRVSNPTVVDVLFSPTENLQYATVFDKSTKTFIYSVYRDINSVHPQIYSISDENNKSYYVLFDNDLKTGDNFYLNQTGSGKTTLKIYYNTAINSDALSLTLAENVTLPNRVTITAIDPSGKEVTLLKSYIPSSNKIKFPSFKSNSWKVTMDYSQMLRIYEIGFNDLDNPIDSRSLRFLALPNHLYSVYSNPESARYDLDTNDRPNLNSATVVNKIGPLYLVPNTNYKPTDTDSDGIPDYSDNCKQISNSDQADQNRNGVGDLCDDDDLDGVINQVDNCLNISNPDQRDTDDDRIGDKCDSDESRLTEKYPTLVWLVLGFAVLVFIALLFVVSKKIKENNKVNTGGNNTNP